MYTRFRTPEFYFYNNRSESPHLGIANAKYRVNQYIQTLKQKQIMLEETARKFF